jgi:hypothetical protein
MSDYDPAVPQASVDTYLSAHGVFSALLGEVRELSKKKPDATLSASKVKLVNNVLTDLLGILKNEPEGKYLAAIEDETLPQVSDALMMMAQFDAALSAFKARYRRNVFGNFKWITEEIVVTWEKNDAARKDDWGPDKRKD